MRLTNYLIIVLAALMLTPGCASDEASHDMAAPTEQDVAADSVAMAPQETEQIAGIGLKNNGPAPVRFYLLDGEQDEVLQELSPEELGTEYDINGYECDLQIEGQTTLWSVERGKRYVFKYRNGAWSFFEV